MLVDKDPRREPVTSSASSLSPPPSDLSVRQLLAQLTVTIRAWTAAIERLEQAVREELAAKMNVMASEQSTLATDIGAAVDIAKLNKSAIIGLRNLLADRNKILAQQSVGLAEATDELKEFTGSHALLPHEPEPRWHIRFVKNAASQGWPHAVRWLCAFGLASFGASTALQEFVDHLFNIAQRRP
jgi:hypothetical protein